MRYWFAILQPQNPSMRPRNARETKTICTALDLLAEERHGEAADLLGQKAIERALKDGHWQRAAWCELTPPRRRDALGPRG
eukprot:6002807-Pyramimonas_sp.AAC.1